MHALRHGARRRGECVDTEARIDAILPELDLMIGGELITLGKVRVIVYRPQQP